MLYTLPVRFGGRTMKKPAAGLLILAFLSACATNPNGGYSDKDCWLGKKSNPDSFDSGIVFVEGVFYLGCQASVAVGNLAVDLKHVVVHGETYRSPDRLFQVNLPGPAARDGGAGFVTMESVTPERDYVTFVQQPGPGAVYSVTDLPNLPERYSVMDIADFSHAVVADSLANLHAADKGAASLELTYEQQVALKGGAAMFAVYRRSGATSGPYYLIYFLKKAHEAAILSVLWHSDSLPTGADPEAAIRTMDPGLQEFVNSFEFGSQD